MREYILDSNIFIQSKNGPYGFDFAPGFWKFIDDKASEGLIYTSTMVYDEIADGEDELADWFKERRTSGMFLAPESVTQGFFGEIADFVTRSYSTVQAQYFLSGADPWVIAEARNSRSIVVTHETLVPSNSTKVKIPNICKQFNIPYMNTYEMLRSLRAKLN